MSVAPENALVQKSDFGAFELQMKQNEIAARAAAAQAEAMVKAKFFMAMQQPRNLDVARQRILKHCKRTEFATAAVWEREIGGEVKAGLSIRWVEMALNEMGNVDHGEQTLYDDEDVRRITVYVTDLERNSTFSRDVTIAKTVERRYAGKREVLGERLNSNGKKVFIVRATDDELLAKQNAWCSKALREIGKKVIPADIQEEARKQCDQTRRAGIQQDPDGARNRVIDAFAELNVSVEDLVEYLGHDIGKASAAKIEHLRGLYVSIKEGDQEWVEVIEKVRTERAEIEAKKKAIRDSAAAVRKKKGQPEPEPPTGGQGDLLPLNKGSAGSPVDSPWPSVGSAKFLEECKDAGLKKKKEVDELCRRRFKRPEAELNDAERGELIAFLTGDADAEANMQAAKESGE